MKGACHNSLKSVFPKLYAVIEHPGNASLQKIVFHVETLLAAGIFWFQLREKTKSYFFRYQLACLILELKKKYSFILIINDDCGLYLRLKKEKQPIDGLHLGQNDLPILEARKKMGFRGILGLSTHNQNQIQNAQKLAVDYLGVGPVFQTSSKKNHEKTLGLPKALSLASQSKKPVFLIGGLKFGHVRKAKRYIFNSQAIGFAMIRSFSGLHWQRGPLNSSHLIQ